MKKGSALDICMDHHSEEISNSRLGPARFRVAGLRDLPGVNELFARTLPHIDRCTRVFNVVRQRGVFVLQLPPRKIAGYAIIASKDNCRTLWIEYMGIAPDLQGQGLGSIILAHVEKLGIKLAAQRVGMRALDSAARSFYERFGYEIDPSDTEQGPRLYKALSLCERSELHAEAVIGRLAIFKPREALQVLTRYAVIGALRVPRTGGNVPQKSACERSPSKAEARIT